MFGCFCGSLSLFGYLRQYLTCYSVDIGLCCCKKSTVKNRAKEVKSGKISFETDPNFKVRIMVVKLDGFLTVTCKLWLEMNEREEESPEYVKRIPSKISFKSLEFLDTVF